MRQLVRNLLIKKSLSAICNTEPPSVITEMAILESSTAKLAGLCKRIFVTKDSKPGEFQISSKKEI